MIDKYTWDEADFKIKNVIYLSLGSETTRIFHQRNPHTMIDLCSTKELVYELELTFTRPRNLTFDRFQLITVQQNANENLETFFSCLRELGSKCALGNVKDDLIKDFFIAKMINSTKQTELLSEVRTPAQVLIFALSRERGQENQREIMRSSTTNWNTQVSAISYNTTHNSARQQQPAQKKHKQKTVLEIRRNLHPGQLNRHNASSAKRQAILQKCAALKHLQPATKKPTKRRIPTSPGTYPKPTPSSTNPRTPKKEGQNDQAESETMDPQSASYIRELTEDWVDVDHITPRAFNLMKNTALNKTQPKEIWVKTTRSNKQMIYCLADTVSPKSFITLEKAKKIITNNPKLKLQPYNSQTQYRCFNNNYIKLEGRLRLTLQSGSWTAEDCQVLVVGRNILQKLGISLQQRPKQSPGNHIYSISYTETEKKYRKVDT